MPSSPNCLGADGRVRGYGLALDIVAWFAGGGHWVAAIAPAVARKEDHRTSLQLALGRVWQFLRSESQSYRVTLEPTLRVPYSPRKSELLTTVTSLTTLAGFGSDETLPRTVVVFVLAQNQFSGWSLAPRSGHTK